MLDLSPQQKAAVQHIRGPLLVLGGAGNGKTAVLAGKVAWLVRELDVDPTQIVVLATSVHATRELRRRAEELLGRKLPTLSVIGFAEFGLQLIQRRFATLGLRPGFSLYDRADTEAVITRLLQESQPQVATLAGGVARQIARWKRGFASPAFTTDSPDTSVASVAAWAYQRYEQRLLAANSIDLDDLVRKAVRLLTTDALLLSRWRDQIRFLLVDEYERTSACEHELVRLLAADGIALTAAGDDTRTVDTPALGPSDNLARLPTAIPNTRVIKLEQNFRCTGRIAVALSRIVGGEGGFSDDAPSYGARPGPPIRILQVRNEQHEAEGIVAALTAHQARSGADYRDYAILFRDLDQAAVIERALRVSRVPYQLQGAPSFFAQSEIRDMWAYLRILSNPADDDAFLHALNTPRRDIGHATIDRLTRFAAASGRPLLECALDPVFIETLPPQPAQALGAAVQLLTRLTERAAETDPAEIARDLLAELRYRDWLRDTCNDAKIAAQRMHNVTRVIDMLQRASRLQPDAGLRAVFTQLQLQALRHGAEDSADGVALLTFAAARGTEFAQQIYIIGFEEELSAAAPSDTEIEALSERHLAYLMISRAREGVTFTISAQRRLGGALQTPRASQFLADLPPQDLQWISADTGQAFAENSLVNSTTYVDRGNHRSR